MKTSLSALTSNTKGGCITTEACITAFTKNKKLHNCSLILEGVALPDLPSGIRYYRGEAIFFLPIVEPSFFTHRRVGLFLPIVEDLL